MLAREKWSVVKVGGGERERWLEVIFFYGNILILTKFRSMSRQSVVCIIETYNHIYGRS